MAVTSTTGSKQSASCAPGARAEGRCVGIFESGAVDGGAAEGPRPAPCDPGSRRQRRAGSEAVVDHVAIDLDLPDGLPFERVLDVARWVRDELTLPKAPGFPETSGAGGVHIYVPIPAGTGYDTGLLFCRIVSTMVAKKHPKLATVERSIKARGRRIYLDYRSGSPRQETCGRLSGRRRAPT